MALVPEWQVGGSAVSLIEPLGGGVLLVGDREGRLSRFDGGRWAWTARLGVENADLAKLYRLRSAAHVPGTALVAAVSGPAVWGLDLADGRVLWRRRSAFHWGFFPSRPAAVAAGEDGELWACYDDGRVESLSHTGQVAARWHEPEGPVAFARRGPAEERVACTGYGIGAWRMADRARAWHRRLPERALAFASSADGETVAYAAIGRTVVGSALGETRRELPVEAALPAVALRPDGAEVAVPSADGLARASFDAGWKQTLALAHGRVSALAYDDDGRLWYGTSDGGLGVVTAA